MSNIDKLKFVKFPVLDHGFICLVDAMGDDSSIVQAAKTSYGKDVLERYVNPACTMCGGTGIITDTEDYEWPCYCGNNKVADKDRTLIRYLMRHSHTTPFEMVEIKFMVQVPMDCWRQWIRHRTANVNEYSTRYTEAIDLCQGTDPTQWRLQATDNKQGSDGFLSEWPDNVNERPDDLTPGEYLSAREASSHETLRKLYTERLHFGVAKEQARKDLPLSTYTRAYWKCDLHNIFGFLRLRMDSHAQIEVRSYANAMFEIVKQIVPVACEAFEDYVLNGCRMSAMEMEMLRKALSYLGPANKPETMSDREWTEFKKKVGI